MHYKIYASKKHTIWDCVACSHLDMPTQIARSLQEREAIIALACKAFPQYATEHNGELTALAGTTPACPTHV